MPAWLVPAIMGVASLVGSLFGQRKQKDANMELAKYQADMNDRYMQRQLEYNTPANQMDRFDKAGLNPNLIYGQGNPGNQSAPQTYPEIGRTNYGDMGVSAAMQMYNNTALNMSQVQAVNARTMQTGALTALNKLQAQVLARNPLLNDPAYLAIIDGLVSTAEIKANESGISKVKLFTDTSSAQWVVLQMQREVELLEQKYKLGDLDAKLKAEVLKSKGFQNDILEVQKRFMTESEVTPQHILQFIQLLLMKIL